MTTPAARLVHQAARLGRRNPGAWCLLALLGAFACSAGACNTIEPMPDGMPTNFNDPTCPDIDGDGFSMMGCRNGKDCDDAEPYVNPDMVDGPWSLQSRYVPQREVVQWFSIEGDTTHWLTQSISRQNGSDPEALNYYQASGIDFGIPQMIDDRMMGGHDAKLLWDGTQAHVLHRSGDYIRELRYSSDALDWQQETVATTVGQMRSRMVMMGDELHMLFHSEERMGDPLRYGIRREGQWEITGLGQGRADALLKGAGNVLHIIAGDATVCFHHGQSPDGKKWSFEDYVHDLGCEVLDARIGQDHRLHVLYRSYQTVWLASYDGELWSTDRVHSAVVNFGTLPLPHRAYVQVDSAGVAHITYAADDSSSETPLYYTENSGGDWNTEIVANQLSHVLAMSPQGEPVVGLSRTIDSSTHPQLVIARRTGNDGIDQNCNGVDGE